MRSSHERSKQLFESARRWIVATLTLLGVSHAGGALVPSDATLVSDKLTWNQAPYNSFTDLTYYNGAFYTVFREASQHLVPPVGTHGGEIRVLRSTDGNTWSSAALISMTSNDDLRDPKISVTPTGQLMLLSSDSHENGVIRTNYTWFSSNGTSWSTPSFAGETGWWLWRTVWHGSTGYGISYNSNMTRLYSTTDGKTFKTIVSKLNSGDEAGLLFEPNGTAVALIRSDTGDDLASIGTASGPNYTNWTFTKSNEFVGGPNIIQLPDGRIVAAGRMTDGGTARTSLMFLDPATDQLHEFMTLPSGGDTGYPGLVWHDNALWVSYYGSQSGTASVYMAEVNFASIPEPATGGLMLISTAWFLRRPRHSNKSELKGTRA